MYSDNCTREKIRGKVKDGFMKIEVKVEDRLMKYFKAEIKVEDRVLTS